LHAASRGQAFRELGVAVRTGFLLQYIHDAELRATIQAATNKSESFNAFVKWLAFGGGGVLAENDRGEQRKLIKYNHLLANCLIFHNVCMMTRALHKLRAEGVTVEPAAVAALSPYLRSHITRFGQYNVDLSRRPAPINYELPIFTDADTAPSYPSPPQLDGAGSVSHNAALVTICTVTLTRPGNGASRSAARAVPMVTLELRSTTSLCPESGRSIAEPATLAVARRSR